VYLGSHVTHKKRKKKNPNNRHDNYNKPTQQQLQFHCCLQRETLSLFTCSNQIRRLPTYHDFSTQHPDHTCNHPTFLKLESIQANLTCKSRGSHYIYNLDRSLPNSAHRPPLPPTTQPQPTQDLATATPNLSNQEYIAVHLLHHSDSDHIKAAHHFRKKKRGANKKTPIPASQLPNSPPPL
jgi:hypothetical protein